MVTHIVTQSDTESESDWHQDRIEFNYNYYTLSQEQKQMVLKKVLLQCEIDDGKHDQQKNRNVVKAEGIRNLINRIHKRILEDYPLNEQEKLQDYK